MNRVIHFEIPVDDPKRASDFYRSVFGWKIDQWDGPTDYWLVNTGEDPEPGISGALTRRQEGFMNIVNTVGVDSVDAFVTRIEASGGKILAGKMPIPGMGWVAYAQDTEGNNFGVFQLDTSSK
jgi:uncharacterized protein